MKAMMREVDLVFHVPVPQPPGSWHQIVLQIGLLDGELDICFRIAGSAELIPVAVLDGIQEAVAWAQANVRPEDLVEMDPEDRSGE